MLSGKAALQCWERRVEGLRNQRGQGRGGCRLALEGLCMRGTRGVIGMGVERGVGWRTTMVWEEGWVGRWVRERHVGRVCYLHRLTSATTENIQTAKQPETQKFLL